MTPAMMAAQGSITLQPAVTATCGQAQGACMHACVSRRYWQGVPFEASKGVWIGCPLWAVAALQCVGMRGLWVQHAVWVML